MDAKVEDPSAAELCSEDDQRTPQPSIVKHLETVALVVPSKGEEPPKIVIKSTKDVSSYAYHAMWITKTIVCAYVTYVVTGIPEEDVLEIEIEGKKAMKLQATYSNSTMGLSSTKFRIEGPLRLLSQEYGSAVWMRMIKARENDHNVDIVFMFNVVE